ncbi:MAG: hypothetical protein SGJ20_07900 [Planctomycetota bacterium]|nr:hypothetical protein [Planctomycetota bacterium]
MTSPTHHFRHLPHGWGHLSLALLFAVVATLSLLRAEQLAPTKKEANRSKPRPLVTIGKETTVITEPLLPSGYPDYLAALNQHTSQGVTPQNNGAIVLLKVMGPQCLSESFDANAEPGAQYYQKLGIKPLPAKGDYFVPWDEYTKSILDQDLPPFAELTQEEVDNGPSIEPGEINREAILFSLITATTRRPWVARDYPYVAAWLKAQEKPLSLLEEIRRRDRYYSPVVASQDSELLGTFDPLLLPNASRHFLVEALCARAMLACGERRFDAMLRDIEIGLRICNYHRQTTQGTHWIVGNNLQSTIQTAICTFMMHPQISEAQLLGLYLALDRNKTPASYWQAIQVGERYEVLSAVCRMAAGGTNVDGEDYWYRGFRRYVWDFDLVLRLINERINVITRISRIQDPVRRHELYQSFMSEVPISAFDPFETRSPGVIESLANTVSLLSREARSRELAANSLMYRVDPYLYYLKYFELNEQTTTQLNFLSISLAHYRQKHGHFPKTLNQLAPDYIDAVPLDPYSGEPFVYKSKRTEMLLYSIGRDKQDSGGYNGLVSDHDDPAIFTEGMSPVKPVEPLEDF